MRRCATAQFLLFSLPLAVVDGTMHLTDDMISLERVLQETAVPEAGALAVFAGTVRNHNEGRPVVRLSYSAHRPLAEKMLAQIECQTLERFDITACRVLHRLGPLAIGDTSVLIVVRSVHRGEAFEASRYAIEAVKHQVPIWKLEEYADGTRSYVKGCSLNEGHHIEA